ncbi:multidrug efflux system outer membrane protein [Sphingomonas naasensis]|uniref:Efflux transporter outer membrane subunit n=1 Tax=Sphingomonas naasensis TaxID=1344951 RepID=A0A4S1WDE8_9SPHN|nr:efflux transporter outer membrane subunit [Sphingomonas naasensis]NIJ22447.1 multidrug efflux system outer membrane protein [Sphingomonas naasensis]TGX40573.1 efflux transporter outer membrane subunit [Sphingomonas naasensis]
MTMGVMAALALAGCSMEPKYIQPAAPVPPGWPVGDAYLRQSEAALPAVTYRDIFRDARLQKLIEQALTENRDLRLAAANIRAAREQYRIQRADRLPDVSAGAGATVSGGQSSNSAASSGSDPRTRFTADVGITGFELDLFGRVASLTRAEQNRYFATEAGARATYLTLVGDIASAWLTYAADASLLQIAQDTAANAGNSVRLTRARLQGGIAPRTDLRQAEQVLEGARADLAEQRTALAQDINALQLLVGAPIDPALLPKSLDEAAPTIAELPAGVDSGVLLRRPDVVQAEYQLRAANAEIGAARAALFPRISLTGLLGLASNALTGLFSGSGFNWSAGGDASYSIFNAGAGKANVRLSEAQRDAAVASYERAIQSAFREVADALARRGTITEQLRATQAQESAAADTFRLAEARYRGGIDTFLSSLDAQRSLYSARRTLVNTRLVQASNLVTLYRTLGGDSLLQATPQGPETVSTQP